MFKVDCILPLWNRDYGSLSQVLNIRTGKLEPLIQNLSPQEEQEVTSNSVLTFPYCLKQLIFLLYIRKIYTRKFL